VAELPVTPVVAAVVLTHNAPRALSRCLAALAAQERPADLVLVVDNASSPPVVGAALPTGPRVVRSEVNSGPAGGHHMGLASFLGTDATHAWVMDDDCVPAPAALRHLLTAVTNAGLIYPTWVDEPTGTRVDWPAWCGFLLAREVVEQVGLPRADFVWWAEDTEYLHWRIREAGVTVTRVPAAIVLHGRVRRHGPKPAWKYYYETRNTVYFRLYVQRHRGRRFYRLARSLLRLGGGALRGPTPLRDGTMVLRGAADGLLRRLGPRVVLVASERVAPPSGTS
jgi:GT2 family glycosyltransferase